MGQSDSTVSNTYQMTMELAASVVLSSRQICANSMTVDNIMNFKCQFSPADLDAKANSSACNNCYKTSAAQVNPSVCDQQCTIPCVYTNLKQTATLSFSGSCTISSSAVQEMKAELESKLDQKVSDVKDALGSALANLTKPQGGNSSVTNYADLKQKISSTLTVESIQEARNALSARQEISASAGYVNGVTQDLALQMVTGALSGTSAGQDLAVLMKSAGGQDASAKMEGPFTVLAALFGNNVFLILAAGLGFIYLTGGGGSSRSSSSQGQGQLAASSRYRRNRK